MEESRLLALENELESAKSSTASSASDSVSSIESCSSSHSDLADSSPESSPKHVDSDSEQVPTLGLLKNVPLNGSNPSSDAESEASHSSGRLLLKLSKKTIRRRSSKTPSFTDEKMEAASSTDLDDTLKADESISETNSSMITSSPQCGESPNPPEQKQKKKRGRPRKVLASSSSQDQQPSSSPVKSTTNKKDSDTNISSLKRVHQETDKTSMSVSTKKAKKLSGPSKVEVKNRTGRSSSLSSNAESVKGKSANVERKSSPMFDNEDSDEFPELVIDIPNV